MKVCYCFMASHGDRDEMLAQNVYRALDHVDQVIFINGGKFHFEIQDWEKVQTIHSPWEDNFPRQRTKYIRAVDELQKVWQDDVLICTADDDEWYSETLWEQIREVGTWAFENDVNQLGIRCHSVTLNLQGNRIRETIDEYWKGLLILWEPGIEYIATGPDRITPSTSSFVHEFLIIPSGVRMARLPDEFFYDHIKTVGDVWFRAARNVWAGGGGPNLGDANPLWKPFQELVQRVAPHVHTSMDFEAYLREGKLHPTIRDAILSFRHLGTVHDPQTNLWVTWPDGTSEWREISKAYFILLHPEELPSEIIEEDLGKIDWLREIEEVHGLVPT